MECDIPCRDVKVGVNVLEIHIPEGEPLSKEACLQSVEAARKFLKPESNVLQFGRMFDAVKCHAMQGGEFYEVLGILR